MGIRLQLQLPLLVMVAGTLAMGVLVIRSNLLQQERLVADRIGQLAQAVTTVSIPRTNHILQLMKVMSGADLLLTDATGRTLTAEDGIGLTTIAGPQGHWETKGSFPAEPRVQSVQGVDFYVREVPFGPNPQEAPILVILIPKPPLIEELKRAVIKDAAKYLRQLQWDEGEGRDSTHPGFGGAGYEPSSRPDLSNTQLFLDALVEAGLPKNDAAFQKALAFVSRCQNLATENNTLPLAGKINDGSFAYTPLTAEAAKEGNGLPGYGSMTYAGIKSMIYCGVDAKDPRMIKALEWIATHYDLDRHPGMPKGQESSGLFYYYHTLAKCLDTMGLEELKDAKGVSHPWRKELTEKLVGLQKPDGSWANTNRAFMENNPDLATGFALMALAHAKGLSSKP